MKNYLLDERLFQYPESFKKLIELNLVDFDIWYLLDSEWALSLYEGLQERYPSRKLIPFAKRGDCDDTACFEIGRAIRSNSFMILLQKAGNNEKSLTIFGNGWNMRSNA